MTPKSNALNLAQSAFEAVCKERDEAREEAINKTESIQLAANRIDELKQRSEHWCDMHTIAAIERDEAREQLQAMREAIREAWIEINYAESGFAGLALRVCPNDSAVDLVLSRMTAALAKLQPFLP